MALESSRIPCERLAAGGDAAGGFQSLFENQPIVPAEIAVGFPQDFGAFPFGGFAEVVNVAGHFHQLAQRPVCNSNQRGARGRSLQCGEDFIYRQAHDIFITA